MITLSVIFKVTEGRRTAAGWEDTAVLIFHPLEDGCLDDAQDFWAAGAKRIKLRVDDSAEPWVWP